ncbi:MAG: DUF2207 domain-containing protein [Ilumatobacteraceae bacterium]
MAALLTAVGLFGALSGPPAAAADKSFSFAAWVADGLVNLDGSMTVTEQLTYDFRGGPFTVGIRSFDRGLEQVESFSAADDQGPLSVVAPADSISGQWEWTLRGPVSDALQTFTLTYVVRDIAVIGSDVGDVNWEPIGTDHPGITSADVTIRFVATVTPALPGVADDDASVLRGFLHGPVGTGLVTVDVSTVRATASDLSEGQFMGLRAVAPVSAFTAAPSTTPLLASILAEERGFIAEGDGQQESNARHGLAWVLTPIVSALGALGLGALWFTSGREKKSAEVLGDYWREPLDEPPAVAIANLRRGTIDAAHTISGTIVDLAQRGYLTITGERVDRLGPDATMHRYRWAGKPFGPDVLPYEQRVVDMVFRGVAETTSQDLQDWAQKNQSEAKRLLDAVTAGVKAEYTTRKYETSTGGRAMLTLGGVCAAVVLLSIGVTIYTGNGFGWFGVAAAAGIAIAGLRLLSNRTQAGVEAAAKAAGLKRYLEDFSRLEDAPVGHLILWERYLVYAVALGVSADLVRGMAVRVPEVLNNPAFGLWYVGTNRRFDGFDAIEVSTSSIITAATPNTSGAGGGASFGGGGSGFGGGGAGAR